MRIGSCRLKNRVVLAPMAGITDSVFRTLAVEMGAGLVFTEMISAKGVICSPENTLRLAAFSERERPIGIQIFGSDPEIMAQAARILAAKKPDLIDINMGCPVRKVVSKGEGCALMKDPKKAAEITRAVVEAVNLPVTVKMRKGWDDSSPNCVEVALAVAGAGAAAITIHGRTAAQGYSGLADWRAIAKVKDAVAIPVIGSGDVFKPEDAEKMMNETGCDAVMIGRGALGNPWLIRRTVHYLETGELAEEPSLKERVSFALRHLHMMVESKGEVVAVREMRKHVAWYIKGFHGAARMREEVMKAKTVEEVTELLNKFAEQA